MQQIAKRFPRAKKSYHCDLCRGSINKGEQYSYQFNTDGGEAYAFRSHLECDFVCNELWEFMNPWDGVTDWEFLDGCTEFCRRMICPNCAEWDKKCNECLKDELYCLEKVVEKLKEYDFCWIKPPVDVPEAVGKRCWGFVKKDTPVTELPRSTK